MSCSRRRRADLQTTFFQHPAAASATASSTRSTAVYGKDHDVIYEHHVDQPDLMPPMTHMGPAAPCGLHRYESDEFGKEYTNNLFACQFNLRKVSRHVLVPKGSTYETKDTTSSSRTTSTSTRRT
jgi:glucose/arabinose dehydrogenase